MRWNRIVPEWTATFWSGSNFLHVFCRCYHFHLIQQQLQYRSLEIGSSVAIHMICLRGHFKCTKDPEVLSFIKKKKKIINPGIKRQISNAGGAKTAGFQHSPSLCLPESFSFSLHMDTMHTKLEGIVSLWKSVKNLICGILMLIRPICLQGELSFSLAPRPPKGEKQRPPRLAE